MKKQWSEEAEIKKSKQIYNVDPYIDKDGIIRVGGRLNKLNLNNEYKYPIVLPKCSPISKLIIAWCHKKTGHAGRGMTLNEIQTFRFWIVCANSTTHRFIHYCVVCRSLRGKLGEQKMVELPFDRLQEEPPFTYCGIDLFGPFVICSRRKELKRYGVTFTCLCSHAIHVEVTHSLDTDSILLTFRRLIGRRVNTRQMRSGNGSNFDRAVKELQKSFQDMNHSRINEYLQMLACFELAKSVGRTFDSLSKEIQVEKFR